jgi:hypothetical protein
MNSILRVGDGDRLYGEQWNLSGDCQVSIVESFLHAIVSRNYSTKPVVSFNSNLSSKFGNIYLTYSTSKVTVKCLLSSGIKTHGCRLFSFIDLFLPYFIKLCLNIHPKIPLKYDFSI